MKGTPDGSDVPFHLLTHSPFHLFTLSPIHPFTLSPIHCSYSCAGNGSIVSGFTGTCTSSRYGDVMSVTRMRGNAFMNAM